MRRTAAVLVSTTLLALGLGTLGSDEARRPPTVTVVLLPDVTAGQRQAVEARLRAVPGGAEVLFVPGEQSYAMVAESLADRPDVRVLLRIEDFTDILLLLFDSPGDFRRAVADPLHAQLWQLPGVDEVTYPGSPDRAPLRHCRSGPARVPDDPAEGDTPAEGDDPAEGDTPAGTPDFWVVPHARISPTQRQAVEARLRAVPGVVRTSLDSQALVPDGTTVGSGFRRGNPHDYAYRVTLADQVAAEGVVDADLDTELCRMPGVELVVNPPERLR